MIGQNMTIGINTVNAVNGSIAITLPNGTQTIIATQAAENITYTPMILGAHNITFSAYGAYNDSTNVNDSFQAFVPTIFSMQIVDPNDTGMNATITIMYNSTVIENRTLTDGNYTNSTPNTTLDIRITGYNDGTTVLMNGIDPIIDTGKRFSMDRPSLPGFVTAYAFESDHGFTDAEVTVRYEGEEYDDDRYLTFHVCHDYNFTNRTCNTEFTDITGNSTQDFTDGTFTTTVTGFSAFAVRQETNEEDTPPTTNGGCSYRIECDPWPETCEDGMRTRSCAYVTTCDGSRKVYEEARRCGVDERPPTIAPLQMVGFIDLADSEVEAGGEVRIKINVQTPDDNAAVAFIYEIDGQDLAQDMREERIIDGIESFYASIDIGDLPPGKYNLTVKARYGGEQTMLKEQFTIIERTGELETADPEGDAILPSIEQPSTLAANSASESQSINGRGIIGEVSSAIRTILDVVISPIRSFGERIITASSDMHLALSIAVLMPILYLIIRTSRVRAKKTRTTRLTREEKRKQDSTPSMILQQSPVQSSVQPTSPQSAPIQPILIQPAPVAQPANILSAPDRHDDPNIGTILTDTALEEKNRTSMALEKKATPPDTTAPATAPEEIPKGAIPEAITVTLPATEHIRSLCRQIVACDGFSDAHDIYAALHEQYAALLDDARTQVHDDILHAQERIETLYFDTSLVELDGLLDKDLHAALELYRRISADADRMSPAQFQRLVEHSHAFAQRVGLKGV